VIRWIHPHQHRSRAVKALYKNDLETECQRVLQCEQCRRVFHRDVLASYNIAFILWHVLKWGVHPWSPARE